MDFTQRYTSPLGILTMISSGEALSGLYFDRQRFFSAPLSEEKDLPVFAETRRWLDLYFSGRDPGFTPQLSLHGTGFRTAVWEILLTVPFGQTVTYGEIARRIARQKGQARMSAQAVGGAVGHNPVALIVPCHRVIGADGSLTGYGAGLGRKARLLELEGIAAGIPFSPEKGIGQ